MGKLGKVLIVIALGLLLAAGIGGCMKYEEKIRKLLDELTD